MKALILAAGYGSRLQSVSEALPKGLVRVGGRPLLDRQIDLLQARGVERICIVTGYEHALIEQRYGQRVDYRYNPFFRDANNMVSFLFARDWIDDDVIVLYADLLYAPEILDAACRSPARLGLLVDSSAIEPGHALVSIRDGLIRKIDRLLAPGEADARFIGIAKLTRQGVADLLPEIENAAKAGRIDQYYTVGMAQLMARGYPVTPIDVTGRRWLEIDSPADLIRARAEWA